MKTIYLHGMGGSPADWRGVSRKVPGACLPVPCKDTFPETVAALCQALDGESSLLLCGYSMGGRLALAMAPYLGSSLKGLVLLSAGMGFSDEKARQERKVLDQKWAGLARESPPLFWEKWYSQPLFSTFSEVPKGAQSAWMKERLSLDINNLTNQLVNLSPASHGDLGENLPGLTKAGISVLYIAGERDKKYANLANRLQQEGLKTELIPGAGHILPLEAPDAISAILLRFQADLEGK